MISQDLEPLRDMAEMRLRLCSESGNHKEEIIKEERKPLNSDPRFYSENYSVAHLRDIRNYN